MLGAEKLAVHEEGKLEGTRQLLKGSVGLALVKIPEAEQCMRIFPHVLLGQNLPGKSFLSADQKQRNMEQYSSVKCRCICQCACLFS